ncbi:hypothetical protein EIP91_009885 [Steccherinum ochraceum]|uniref:Protein kinase domain-containing protein n=1 Tax=Steccherinum ochraceum TaxID=92696 RepID=A0A4R0RT66_9APHY|nr:hypothetical protein EIP91_009885 [Steccherinum ochraceum]
MRVVPSACLPSDFAGQLIDDGRLRLVEVLGEGAHGVVYRAVEESSAGSSSSPEPKEYAVKIQVKADETTLLGQCQAREIITHKIASDHPNVVTLHKVIEDDWFVFIVTDYCPGGDLHTVAIEQRHYARDDTLVKKIFIQILDAVQSIHDHGIYHRDLKPENILVSADSNEIYLADFGLATDVLKSTAFRCGSTYYMSPECIGEELNFMRYSTEKADIWALGIILVNLMTGRGPWEYATTDDHHFSQYLADNEHLLSVLPITAGANEILKGVFKFNPFARISIAEMREQILALDTFFLTDEEIARSTPLVRHAAEQFFPQPAVSVSKEVGEVVADTKGSVEFTSKADDGAAGYPHITPEDAYALVSPDPKATPLFRAPSLLSASRIFTIGSASDDSNSTSSESSSGSCTGSSGAASSTGPITPEVQWVDNADMFSLCASLAVCGLASSAQKQMGPTPIHCLVQGIEEIMGMGVF